MISLKICLICTALLGIFLGRVDAGPDHKKLLSDLFINYDTNERPVLHENETVHVKFGITIFNVIDVNIAQGYFEANIWLTMEWKDVHLKWNPASYGGIKSLSVEANKLWKPDILAYNSIHNEFDATHETNILLKSDGTINYIPPGIFRTSCSTDVGDYPFDEHKCPLKFGSWTWDGGKVNISIVGKEAVMSGFIPHKEWEIMEAPGEVKTVYYSCCPEPYVDVTYIVHLKIVPPGWLSTNLGHQCGDKIASNA